MVHARRIFFPLRGGGLTHRTASNLVRGARCEFPWVRENVDPTAFAFPTYHFLETDENKSMAFGIESNSTEFGNYQPTAKDPGGQFTFGVITVCLLLNFFFGIWLRCHTKKPLIPQRSENVTTIHDQHQESVAASQLEDDESSSSGSIGSRVSVVSQLVSNVLDARSKMKRSRGCSLHVLL